MRNRFDRQLDILNKQLIHMGELCETAIEEAAKDVYKRQILQMIQ